MSVGLPWRWPSHHTACWTIHYKANNHYIVLVSSLVSDCNSVLNRRQCTETACGTTVRERQRADQWLCQTYSKIIDQRMVDYRCVHSKSFPRRLSLHQFFLLPQIVNASSSLNRRLPSPPLPLSWNLAGHQPRKQSVKISFNFSRTDQISLVSSVPPLTLLTQLSFLFASFFLIFFLSFLSFCTILYFLVERRQFYFSGFLFLIGVKIDGVLFLNK